MEAAPAAPLARVARESKHGQGAALTAVERREGAISTVRLSAHLANEFLCKKDYLKNWDIEVHEEYGVFTVAEWREALGRNFFEVRTIKTYVNERIRQNRYQG